MEKEYNQHEKSWQTISGWFMIIFLITVPLKLLTVVSIPWVNVIALFGIALVCSLYSGWHYCSRTKKEKNKNEENA